MEKVNEVCRHCSEKHCCRGLCKELNEYLVKKKSSIIKKTRNWR